MKKISILFAAVLIFTAAKAFPVNLIPGSQYYYTGLGAREVSLGYTGISELGSLDGSSFNPASLADLRRTANSLLLGGLGTQNFLISPAFAFPTDIGVMSVNALYLGSSQPGSLNTLLGAQFSIAKPITETLFWGFGVKFNAGYSSPVYSDWQLAFDTGIIYSEKSDAAGTGFLDPSYGLVIKNIGKNITLGNYDPFPAMGIGLGASFYPVKLDFYKLKLIGDLTVPFNPFNAAFSIGTENVFLDTFKIRFAYVLNSTNFGVPSVGFLTLGAGFTGKLNIFKDGPTEFDVSYALQNQGFNGTNEWAHFINVTVAWGFYDNVKPEAKATPFFLYFSPNYDGSQDEERIALDIRDNTLVDGWEMQILDSGDQVVKTYKSVEKLQLRTLNIVKFFEKIFSRKQQVEIPSEIVWDGKDDSGKLMPDGEYRYRLFAWDENKNTNDLQSGQIIIDTVIPKLSVSADTTIFSPNGDGVKDDFSVSVQTGSFKTIDRFRVYIKDPRGNNVRAYDFGSKPPASFSWDGKNDSGQSVPEGDYSVNVFIENPAGNNVQSRIDSIRLVTNYQAVSLGQKTAAFSPVVNGQNTVSLKPSVSDDKGLESWIFRVYGPNGSVVREIAGSRPLPDEIIWDGLDNSKKTVPDGDYTFDLETFYDSGNHPKTPKGNVRVDATPPTSAAKPEYLSFSPNGDGKQDTLTFALSATGDNADSLEIKIADQNGSVVYYNRYDKIDFPSSFTWNGLDRNLSPLPEGKYTLTVEGSDAVGNRSVTTVGNILLKTGLEKVSIQGDVQAMSPTNAAANGRVVLTPSVTSKDGIVSFTVEIRDIGNALVRSFRFGHFTNRLEWDGKDDAGRLVKDGTYYYSLKVKYNYGDEPQSAAKPVRVKASVPEISVSSDTRIFSPNGDGVRDSLVFSQNVTSADKADIYEAVIADKSGKPVRSYKWTGSIPKEITWNGKDDKGKNAESGVYTYIITGTDVAGNRVMKTIENIKLVREFEKLTFSAETKAFSPNGDGVSDTVAFISSLSSTNDILLSELVIYDSLGRALRVIDRTNGIDERIVWDGKDDDGNEMPDGVYSAEMDCVFESGNQVIARIDGILLSKNPPAYKLIVSPALFTPDGDGENDNLTISLEVTNPAPIVAWSLGIYKKLDNGARGPLFKEFSGSNAVKKIFIWDGMSADGQDQVEAVQDYVLALAAEDALGNRLTNVQKTVPVGVLVEKTPEGLRIRVSSVQFDFNSARLAGDSSAVLDKVIGIIRKILSDRKKYGITENYRIEIGGHTDDVGSEEYNQKLSERRAQSVYDYFIEKDVDPKILTSVGYGKTRPYKIIFAGMENDKKEEYRARNRRVEFFIRK